jgi:curli biogenesis system outer membrane secretion channel CsgG
MGTHMKLHSLCLSLIFLAGLPLPGQAQKKRVAVLDFEYATVQQGVSAIFGQNLDIGKGVADLLVDKLVRDGTYSVIERKAIQRIISEQHLSNSDRADAGTAARIGKLLGVDAIIVGSITTFGRDDRNVGVGGSVFSRQASKYGLGNVGVRNAKAVVGLSARMVSTDTGEIFSVSSGVGESGGRHRHVVGELREHDYRGSDAEGHGGAAGRIGCRRSADSGARGGDRRAGG